MVYLSVAFPLQWTMCIAVCITVCITVCTTVCTTVCITVDHAHVNAGLFAGAAERLRVAKSEVKARLNRESGSTGPPSTPPSPALTNRGSGNLWGGPSAPEVNICIGRCVVHCAMQLSITARDVYLMEECWQQAYRM